MTFVFGSNELAADVQTVDLCVGCGACVDLCPYFKTYLGKTARLFTCDLGKGRCYAYCPKAEVDLGELAQAFWNSPYEGVPLGRYRRLVASRAGEKAPRGNFQGGGSVSAIIADALAGGSMEAAVLTGRDGLVAVPMLVTDPNEVVKAAGSKFMAAPTLAALNRAVRDGRKNIGVVGTPCQMTAVAQMRRNPLGLEDFADPVTLAVGLFCTWALDTRKLMPVITECVGDACILAMDVPPPPAEIMVLDTGDGKSEIPLARIRQLVPNGCRICPDMTSEWADISVGQVEGRPGWNTLIIRTEAGEEAVESAIASGFLEVQELAADLQKALEKAAAGKKARAIRNAAEEGRLNTPAEHGRAALRLPVDAVEKITEI
jgi:coenzyme F420 hydrogenase subunit beta